MNSEQDEIRKNRSCEDINTDRYLEELQSAKKKKENRNKAAEKRAKERAIEKNIYISSHQGEAEEGQEKRMLEKYLLRFVVFKRDLLNVFRC